MLDGGIAKLTDEQRASWCRFLIAQPYRSPDKISKLIRVTKDSIFTELSRSTEQYESMRAKTGPATIYEFREQNLRERDDRAVALGGVLPGLISDQGKINFISDLRWVVHDLSTSKLDLLTSDRPMILDGSLRIGSPIYYPIREG